MGLPDLQRTFGKKKKTEISMLKQLFLFIAVVALLCISGSINRAQAVHTDFMQQSSGDTLRKVSKSMINKIAQQLIAPCCWTQTADVHPSASSDKIKAQIEAALIEGQTEEQIINFFVAEYGERIRAVPKPVGFNLFLWILPASVLLFGTLIIVLVLRHVTRLKLRTNDTPHTQMNETELKRVESELKEFDN